VPLSDLFGTLWAHARGVVRRSAQTLGARSFLILRHELAVTGGVGADHEYGNHRDQVERGM
jgi:hypothetical protein